MEAREYEVMYHAEDHHWWYLGMAAIIRELICQRIKPTCPLRILDAGCGTGKTLKSILADYGSVTGFDISRLALEFCQKRSLRRLAQASVEAIPFPARCFDLVTCLDVLYEQAVRSDRQALAEFARVLTPGGYVLLRLPAYDWLRGQHDRIVHTQQRYTKGQVIRLLSGSGFRVHLASYANMTLFLPILVKRLGERLVLHGALRSDLEVPLGPLNGLLRVILSSEVSLISRPGLPFGLSVIALGQKVV